MSRPPHLRAALRCSRVHLCGAGALLWMGLAGAAAAQQVRVTGVTSLQFVEVRPFATDSVDVETTLGDGLLRRTTAGEIVRCVTGDRFCRLLRSEDPISSVPGTQDLHVSAWGLGRGVRLYAHLRSRGTLAGENRLWPRSDDHFDALEAFLELRRSGYRVRAGRLWKSSGLGYYNYDGASISAVLVPALSVEAYAGWSLARGLSEPRSGGALATIEAFAPDDRGQIVGVEARYRPSSRTAASVLYQREIRQDRRGLYSERLAASAFFRTGRLRAEGRMEVDLVTVELNEARLGLDARVTPQLSTAVFVRRYRPFFELWTIWGAFDPVGFDEAGLSGAWRPRAHELTLTARTSRRWYPEVHTGFGPTPIRSDGWRLALDGRGRLADDWDLEAGFLADVGFGAAKSQERVRVTRSIGEGRYVAAALLAFQSLFEFRVDEGTVLGLALDGGTPLGPRARAVGTLAVYRHTGTGNQPEIDWSQLRASIRFEWTVGAEPGAVVGGGRP